MARSGTLRRTIGAMALATVLVLLPVGTGAQNADPTDTGTVTGAGDGVAGGAGGDATAEVDPGCAFPVIVNQLDANVAYPDTNSTYWAMPTDFALGDDVRVSGQFAYARYQSFNTYTFEGASVGGIHDSEMLPDPGSVNPFAPGESLEGSPRNFTVRVNVTDTPQTPSAIPGAIDIGPGPGWLIVRVYVPFEPTSPAGGVPLPALTVNGTTLEGCTSFSREPLVDALAAVIVNGILGDALPPAPNPEFVFPGGTAGLFPNADNKYVYATTQWQPGRLVVVRALSPTTPDTPAQGLYPPQQLRYWSMCTNLLITPAPVVECAHDHEVALDDDGRYVFVIGADEDRPSDAALSRSTATWLQWFGPLAAASPTKPIGNLILRNMLPDQSFTDAIQGIGEPQSNAAARAAMGPYYPEATYCDHHVFERSGADACFGVAPKFTG